MADEIAALDRAAARELERLAGGRALQRRVRRGRRGRHDPRRRRAAPTRRTGPRCCCACTCAGPSDRGFKTELIEASPGEEAGLKSATLHRRAARTPTAILKAERGVHRLVRLVAVRPGAPPAHVVRAGDRQPAAAPTTRDVEIDEGDLRIDTYRASGAGGQHVNKTDSAVRITHLPTGIVVQCQNERSQTSNKQTAMRILRSRLAERPRRSARRSWRRSAAPCRTADFGSQIRSYVLHPYQLVKDHAHGLRGRQRAGRPRRRSRRIRPRVPAREGRRKGGLAVDFG